MIPLLLAIASIVFVHNPALAGFFAHGFIALLVAAAVRILLG